MYATLMVPIMDDNTTELSEYFMVAINSTDPPSIVIGSPSIVFITIQEPAGTHSNLHVNVPLHLASKMQMLLCSYGMHVCMYSTCECMGLVIECTVCTCGM